MAATNKGVPPSGSICWVKHSMIRRRQSWWPVCVFHRMNDTLFSSVVSPYVSDTLLSGSRSSDCSFVFYFCDHIPVLEARDASDLLEWSQLVPEEMAEMHRNHQMDGEFLSIVDTFAAAIKTSEKVVRFSR